MPYGAYRLYRRGLIGRFEAGMLVVFSSLYIYALVCFWQMPFILEEALLQFSMCSFAAGSIDPLIYRGSAIKLVASRVLFAVFGLGYSFLVGIKSRGYKILLGGNSNVQFGETEHITAWLGLLLCLLSALYFVIRLYKSVRRTPL